MTVFAIPAPAARPRSIGWPAATLIAIAALAALVFLWRAAAPYLTTDPVRFGRLWPRHGWVWVHIAGGTTALLVGPIQLWLGLTRRRVSMHRVLGRVYVGGIAIGAFAALYLAVTTELGWMFESGIIGLAVAWVVTTSLALASVHRRHIAQHREWMIRSYVVTLGFVTFRALFEILGVLQLGTITERVGVAAWFCWALPLLVTEAVIQGRKVWRASPTGVAGRIAEWS